MNPKGSFGPSTAGMRAVASLGPATIRADETGAPASRGANGETDVVKRAWKLTRPGRKVAIAVALPFAVSPGGRR